LFHLLGFDAVIPAVICVAPNTPVQEQSMVENPTAAAVAANLEPLLVSIASAAEILATSRSEIYQKVARGELDAVKDGVRTKITYDSVRRNAAALPKAELKLYVPRARHS
jgi:excisionase family DNA binding protein